MIKLDESLMGHEMNLGEELYSTSKQREQLGASIDNGLERLVRDIFTNPGC